MNWGAGGWLHRRDRHGRRHRHAPGEPDGAAVPGAGGPGPARLRTPERPRRSSCSRRFWRIRPSPRRATASGRRRPNADLLTGPRGAASMSPWRRCGSRLPRRGRRRHGDGFHRRAHRERRRQRRDGRPRTAWAGTGWTPIPSSACTRPPRSTAWPRRCSGRDASRRTVPRSGCTNGPPAGDLRLLRAGAARTDDPLGEGELPPELRVPGRPGRSSRGCPGSGTRSPSGPASSTPATSPRDPGQNPGAVRQRRGGARGGRQRPGGLDHAPSQYVVVGSGKTATDACIWLLDRGVDPDAICWVRPRDPWMLNRAVVQPNPAIFIGMAARGPGDRGRRGDARRDVPRHGGAGVMLRIDRSVTPTMAKTPTLAAWELEQLRTIEHVVRLGHVDHVVPGRLVLGEGEVAWPGTPWSCTAPRRACSTRPWCRSGARGDHAAAGPERFPVLRCGHRRTRRGHPRRRRREEPAVPAVAVLEHDPRLGPDAGARQPGVDGLRRRPRAQGLGRHDVAQPGAGPPGHGRLRRAGAALQRFRTHVGPGLARMEELSGMS